MVGARRPAAESVRGVPYRECARSTSHTEEGRKVSPVHTGGGLAALPNFYEVNTNEDFYTIVGAGVSI